MIRLQAKVLHAPFVSYGGWTRARFTQVSAVFSRLTEMAACVITRLHSKIQRQLSRGIMAAWSTFWGKRPIGSTQTNVAIEENHLGASARLSAAPSHTWAEKRPLWASGEFSLHALGEIDQDGTDVKESAAWSISAPQSTDPAKAVAMGFLLSLSLSWASSVMRLSKTSSGRRMVTARLCPNRKSRKLQANSTHVTLSLRGGCNYAAAFCASALAKRMGSALNVQANYTPFFEVSAC